MRAAILTVVAIAAALAGAPAVAQDGPSFDCGQASTATEAAICDSPRLARLERWVVDTYDDLAGRIGQPVARAVADEQLGRRQDCEGDAACIEERLVETIAVFAALGAQPPGLDLAAIAEAPPEPAPPIIAPPTVAPPQDPPFAALTPEERLAFGPPREVPLDPGIVPEGLAFPRPEAALPPDPAPARAPESLDGSALAEAFAALPPFRRANVQGRLAEAGFAATEGTPDGDWDATTAIALAAVALQAAEEGLRLDPTTSEGADALLAFVDSDAFLDGAEREEAGLAGE